MNKCLGLAKDLANELFKKDISTEKLGKLTKRIENKAKVLVKYNPTLSMSDALTRAAEGFLTEARHNMLKVKQILKLKELDNFKYEEFISRFDGRDDEALISKIGVRQGREKGVRFGFTQKGDGYQSLFLKGQSGWLTLLKEEKATLEGYDTLLDIQADTKHRYEIVTGIAKAQGKVDEKTSHIDFDRIGKIHAESMENRRLLKNSLGADVRKLAGRAFTRRHDRIAMLATSDSWSKDFKFKLKHIGKKGRKIVLDKAFDHWLNFVETLHPKYEQIFPQQELNTIAAKRKAMRSLYDSTLSRVHKEFKDLDNSIEISDLIKNRDYGEMVFKSGAIKSKHRKLIFGSAAEDLKYQEKMGRKSLISSLYNDTIADARDCAMLKEWGPTPLSTFNKRLADTKIKMRDELRWGPQGNLDKAENIMFNLLDRSSPKRFLRTDRFFANYRALTGLVHNGMSVIRSFEDMGLEILNFRRNGDNIFESIGNTIKSHADALTSNEAKEHFYDLLGTGANDNLGHTVRYMREEQFDGIMKGTSALYYKSIGQTGWDENHLESTAAVTALRLGKVSKNPWEKLHLALQNELTVSGIGKEEWEIIRQHTEKSPVGRDIIFPSSVHLNKDIPIHVKKDLELRLMSYLLEQENSVILMPGLGEQYYLTLGRFGRKDTLMGLAEYQVKKFLAQWKSYSVGMYTRVFAKELYGSSANGYAKLGRLAETIAITTVFRIISLYTLNLLRNRTPPDWSKKPIYMDALTPAAGLISESISSPSTFGAGVFSRIASPISGPLVDLYQTVHSKHKLKSLAVMAEHHLPWQNAWWAYAPLRILVFDKLANWLDPGCVQRSQRAVYRKRGEKPLF